MLLTESNVFARDPFDELKRLQRDMNRLFNGYSQGTDVFPAINVWTSEENVVLSAELPGVDPESIDIEVRENVLILQGERKPEDLGSEAVCHRAERGVGRFSRSLRLPYEVENDKIKARFKNGVLNIELPRAESSKPRKIAINVL